MNEMELSIDQVGALAETFVSIASKAEPGVYDYSMGSIARLEVVFDGFHKAGHAAEDMQGTVLSASCYFGEVVRRHVGGEWVDGHAVEVPDEIRFPLMFKLGETYLVPFAKFWKRMENGAEDDLVFYFNAMVAQAGFDVAPIEPVPTRPRSWMDRVLGRKQ